MHDGQSIGFASRHDHWRLGYVPSSSSVLAVADRPHLTSLYVRRLRVCIAEHVPALYLFMSDIRRLKSDILKIPRSVYRTVDYCKLFLLLFNAQCILK